MLNRLRMEFIATALACCTAMCSIADASDRVPLKDGLYAHSVEQCARM